MEDHHNKIPEDCIPIVERPVICSSKSELSSCASLQVGSDGLMLDSVDVQKTSLASPDSNSGLLELSDPVSDSLPSFSVSLILSLLQVKLKKKRFIILIKLAAVDS